MSEEILYDVRDLTMHFPLRRGFLQRQVGAIQAVDGVSFTIRRGETLGLVGESGSGKSTVGRSMLRLETPQRGELRFDGADLLTLEPKALRRARRHLQMVFQDPYASLNPRMRVGRIVREPLDIHRIGTAKDRQRRVFELLERVGLDASHADRFPHEFSGGQRQRIGIARALATKPAFIVADEPISALDVSIQAQIINLLLELRRDLGLTFLFIAHDLAMVRHLSDRVAVMYLGRIVELGECDAVFNAPRHPYTRALIAAIPQPGRRSRAASPAIRGELPDPAAPPSGCRFHTRCPMATDICHRQDPALQDLQTAGASHRVACHHADALDDTGTANDR